MAQHLREHSVAAPSFKKYSRAFSYWKEWTTRRGIPWRLQLPIAEQINQISDFIIDGARHGFGSARPVRGCTIRAALSGIRHFFLATGLEFPADHPQVRMLLKGVGRCDAPSQRKAPVSVALLEACYRALTLQDPADQALWGVLCLAFFFVLRRSEIVATSATSFRWFALKAADVTAIDGSGDPTVDPGAATAVCIRLRGSKTNQGGVPVARMLTRSGHPFLCPVLGALLLLRSRGQLPATAPASTFVTKEGTSSCISASRVAKALRDAARARGEDSSQYSTHSLRSGGATNMYRSGIDALTIQFHGRWASNVFKLYTRLCSESVSAVAAQMVNGASELTTLQ